MCVTYTRAFIHKDVVSVCVCKAHTNTLILMPWVFCSLLYVEIPS